MAKANGKEIVRMLEMLTEACASIQDAKGCGACPLKINCLETEIFGYVVDAVPTSRFEEFLGFAGDIDNYNWKSDMDGHYWDMKRKEYIEERMIDEEWGC